MIGWLSGVVLVRDVTAGEVILDVRGGGYQISVSWQTMAQVPDAALPAEPARPCALWIHTHVREDALALFGFATPQERRMFRLLTSVPQVGPKNAIGVLGGLPLGELLAAIADGERATLERIPGVGKRTAERILLDLKDKVEPLRLSLAGRSETPARRTDDTASSGDPLIEEARVVLVNLGWKPKLVDTALQTVAKGEAPGRSGLDAIVRGALAHLMGR